MIDLDLTQEKETKELGWYETKDGLRPFLVSSNPKVRPEEVTWAPQKGSQEAFLNCNDFEVLFEGTRGPGKTDALLMDFAQFTGKGFGAAWKGILFRQTYKQLGDVITKSKKWFPILYPDAKYNNSDHFWEWPDGERLLLRQFLRDDDYWNYHGHEYPWIGWEELCNWHTDVGYKRMMSCCRSPKRGLPKRVRSTTNPYGPGHNWVKHRFQLPIPPNHIIGRLIDDAVDEEGQPEPPRRAIHGYLQENRMLLTEDPDYVAKLRGAARNQTELKAWLYGSWDIVAGGMFDDVWEAKTHVVEPFIVPHSWRIDRSFDWGSSAPFSVGWWAESDGTDVRLANGQWKSTVRGDLYRIAEWYGWTGKPNEGKRMLATEIAQGIVEREIKMGLYGRVKAGPADTSIFDVENGMSIALDMGKSIRLDNGQIKNGVTWMRADKRAGSRKTGWEMVRKRLKNACKPKNGLIRELPGLYVFRTCDQFIRTVPVLPRDEKDPDDVDSGAEDHIGDELRYRVRASSQRVGSGKTTGMY
jgi:hypothetical protein